MSNRYVIRAWCNGCAGESNNLSTDGNRLYSYKLEIARVVGDNFIIWDYTASGVFMSHTTSKHVGLAIRSSPFADVRHPSEKSQYNA